MASKIIVEGFKSIGERVEVEVRPLTLLAGANSSGKSSLMQAILLLKQTLEANYDPGPLLLNGPNVKFTSVEQLLHGGSTRTDAFTVGFGVSGKTAFEAQFSWSKTMKEIRLCRFRILQKSGHTCELKSKMTREEMIETLPEALRPKAAESSLELVQTRFALKIVQVDDFFEMMFPLVPYDLSPLQKILHIPGLRGNPERSYRLSASGPSFPGTFENYTASVIARWMKTVWGGDWR